MEKRPLKKYPIVGACGLDCGLCPRYYTEGKSRCPGCCGPGFWEVHPGGCGFITCCVKKHNLETCAQCSEQKNCERVTRLLSSADHRDSFISYRPVPANFAFIRDNGFDEFIRLEEAKVGLLQYLLDSYNDGRSKLFYCNSCQLLPVDKLKEALASAEAKISDDLDIKEKARVIREAFNQLADRLKVDLKLRK